MAEDGALPLPLVEAVLHLMAFLELSDDDTVDPDSAITAMESATADLQRLTPDQQTALDAHAQALAARTSDARMAEFLRTFAEAGGLRQSSS